MACLYTGHAGHLFNRDLLVHGSECISMKVVWNCVRIITRVVESTLHDDSTLAMSSLAFLVTELQVCSVSHTPSPLLDYP